MNKKGYFAAVFELVKIAIIIYVFILIMKALSSIN